jgi:hypothetical protein
MDDFPRRGFRACKNFDSQNEGLEHIFDGPWPYICDFSVQVRSSSKALDFTLTSQFTSISMGAKMESVAAKSASQTTIHGRH